MRKVVRKVFFAWEFDKEEKWLNEMDAKGLALVSVGYCRYEFEECIPGEYEYRLELLEDNLNNPSSQQYIGFLEETGVEHVGSWWRWIYFRKKKADGPFELFSDNNSRIKHLTRIITLLCILVGLNLFVGLYNLWLFFIWDSGINFLGVVNLVIGIVAVIGLYRLYKKRERLKADSRLFE